VGAVEIRDLNYRYPEVDSHALRNINLTLEPGEFCSIVGANGAGKTTLCNAIRGFIPHFYKGEVSGEVRVNGKDVHTHHIGDLATDVGFVFQNPFAQMSGATASVFEELAFGLGHIGIEPEEIRRRVERMLALTRTDELRDRNPFMLSGGQQQRVALASILVMEQSVLIIDEPTSQLDPQTTDEVFDLIEMAKGEGRTVVLVEHKMEHVAHYSDRVIVLDKGEIALEGTPAEVFSNPRCEELGTRLPESLYLRRALEESGLDLPEFPLSVSDLADAIQRQAEPSESLMGRI
jgi:energy-coupling factor transport system ATP-binding protein